MLTELDTPPYATVQPKPAPAGLKSHPQYAQIHADVVTSSLTPRQICEKYTLLTSSGTLAIVSIAKYRKQILEKYKDIFAAANELEQQAIRDEVLGKIRHVYDSAVEGHQLAKTQQHLSGRGSQAVLIQSPNFGAMKEQQDSMIQAAEKLADLAGVGVKSTPAQGPMYQDNRTVTILALPKAEGISSRAPLRIVEAQKQA